MFKKIILHFTFLGAWSGEIGPLPGGLTNYCPSVPWHCWLSHLTCKIVPDMTCNVFGGTLNVLNQVFMLSVCGFCVAKTVTSTSTTIRISSTLKSTSSRVDTRASMNTVLINAHHTTTSLCYTLHTATISSISVLSRCLGPTTKRAFPQKLNKDRFLIVL